MPVRREQEVPAHPTALRDEPNDFVNAFLQIDADYRALLLFTYQSYLWNEGVRRLLQLILPREQLFPMPYQAGTLLHHTDARREVMAYIKRTGCTSRSWRRTPPSPIRRWKRP